MTLDELREAESELAACRQARNRLEQLAEQIGHEQHACRRLRERLADERDDVEALERLSVSSLLARARGHLDDDLRRERAEVAAVEVELATQQAALARLTAEFESQRERADDLDAARARVDAALARRAEQLAATGSRAAAELGDLDAQLTAERAARTEIVEAHTAAIGADGALEAAIETMTSARNWSVHDTFFDGDILSSSFKLDRLDHAVELNAAVHASLIRLRTELGELAAAVHHPNLSQPSTRLQTLDRWFDNEISDVITHRKIQRSLDELRRSRDGVRQLVEQLGREEAIATERVSRLEARRDLLLRGL